MTSLVFILALSTSISISVSSETKPPVATEDTIDQKPESSIAHHQYVRLPGAFSYNNIADHIAGIGRGLTPPPPLSGKGISVLETSPAQSFPRVASPQNPKLRRKGRRQKLRAFSNLEFESDQPPPIPQEPDIPPDEDVEVEVTPRSNPSPRDFIPNLIPKEKLPDESDASESEEGRIFKHISVHVPPEDLDEEVSAPRVVKVAREPEKHLKVIFIKPDPENQPLPKTEVQLPPSPVQRTLVYVLTRSGVPTPIRLVKPTTPKPVPPQVYFLRYTNPSPASPTPSSTPEEKAKPRPNSTKPPPIKQQALPPPAKAPATPLLPVNLIQPTVTVPLALHTPILYTFKRNYKILNTPANYRYHTHTHGPSGTSTSGLSQLANNLNNHHHHHYSPLVTTPLVYPLTTTYNSNPYRYTPQNYYRHHHHHHTHPHQYIYTPPSSIVTFPNPYSHHYYDHGHRHNHNSHSHRKHSHYHPVVNTRFIYSCTLFEER